MTLLDSLGRPLRDLRISVTDRCNFRCVYCMPKEAFGRDFAFLERKELLSFEEITRLAKIFKHLGVEKIRLTGGEPLLRKNLEQLVAQLAAIDGLDLTLTTNGSLLAEKAQALKTAGLKRISVSLDALDDATYGAMNDVGFPVSRVLGGIEIARQGGLTPVKINMVVKRGINDGDIVNMARHFKGSGHVLRFIEYMDVGASNGWRMDEVVPSREVVARIHAELPLVAAAENYRGEVAKRWRYQDGIGEIGVIASVTEAFCSDCTRMRLSANGSLYTCLFATRGHDLKHLLRGGASDEAIAHAIGSVWQKRADRYSEIRANPAMRAAKIIPLRKVEMSYIGG